MDHSEGDVSGRVQLRPEKALLSRPDIIKHGLTVENRIQGFSSGSTAVRHMLQNLSIMALPPVLACTEPSSVGEVITPSRDRLETPAAASSAQWRRAAPCHFVTRYLQQEGTSDGTCQPRAQPPRLELVRSLQQTAGPR